MPHELWNAGHVPDVSYFRVFGCKAFVYVPEDKRKKLDPKAIEMMLIGYEPGSKGYRLWNSHTRAIVLSHDVTFNKHSFPSKESSVPSALPLQPTVLDGPVTITLPASEPEAPAPQPELNAPAPRPLPETPQRPLPNRGSTVFHTPPSQPAPGMPPARARPVRIRRDPNVVPNSALPGPSIGPPSPRCLRANPRPNLRYHGEDNAARRGSTGRLSHSALLAAAEYQDPLTFQEAMRSEQADQWHDACQYEIDMLAKNGTWTLVDLPAGRKAIKSKWVFKRKADGCYRACLVAKGFTQIQGIDYDETFSPVARFESLRLILALATLKDWEIHQMDVKSAFLNGLLEEEIYMEQPEGFITPGQESKVCLLKKAIYGLKQASCTWNLQFHGVLVELGFTRTYSNAGIYIYRRQDAGGTLIISSMSTTLQ